MKSAVLEKDFQQENRERQYSHVTERCVSCYQQTEVPVDMKLEERPYYIPGCGQLCSQCYLEIIEIKQGLSLELDEGEKGDGTPHYIQYYAKKVDLPENMFFYEFMKRFFDFFVSFVASIFLVIPFCFIALAIKLDSKGPIFYKQERLREHGKPFMIYKFRTMRTDAEMAGAQWASKDDDRCTKLGTILRKYRIDELPQIPFNILVGNLSFIGPRPERKYFYDEFRKYIAGFDQRLYIKPGLTGLAQVNGGYDLKPEEKIIYDVEYIEKRSFLLDAKILYQTVAVIFTNEGAR